MKGGYEVGYGKPPKSGQFKPGESGNPRGRPRRKGTINPADILEAEIPVSLGGKSLKMHPLESGLRSLVNRAVKGDVGAALQFIHRCEEAGLVEPAARKPGEATGEIYTIPKDWDDDE